MLGDLDDFISPSQACVNPLFTAPSGKADANSGAQQSGGSQVDDATGSVGISSRTRRSRLGNNAPKDAVAAKISLISDFGSSLAYDTSIKPDLIKMSGSTSSASGAGSGAGAARVTLNDCLACSGCVTSAETVLIQQQSSGELLRALSDPNIKAVVVSVSPQALASVAAHSGISDLPTAMAKLRTYLRSLGVAAVVDTQVALDLILAEAGAEFVNRVRASYGCGEAGHDGGGSGAALLQPAHADCRPSPAQLQAPKAEPLAWDAPQNSIAVSATKLRYMSRADSNSNSDAGIGGTVAAAGTGSTSADEDILSSLSFPKFSRPNDGASSAVASSSVIAGPAFTGGVVGGLVPLDPIDAPVPGQGWAARASSAASVGGGAAAAGNTADEPLIDAGASATPPSSSLSSVFHPSQSLPVLASACPGWICYAEKTVPESLPFISTLKSPQQVTGALLKILLSTETVALPQQKGCSNEGCTCKGENSTPLPLSSIYHVALMPCYDKKLEGSRRDFVWERKALIDSVLGGTTGGAATAVAAGGGAEVDNGEVKEVDCVLTALELVDMLQSGVRSAQDAAPPASTPSADGEHAVSAAGASSKSCGCGNGEGRGACCSSPLTGQGPIDLSALPDSHALGLLYSQTTSADASLSASSASTSGALDVERLLSGVTAVSSADAAAYRFCGPSSVHSESDGYLHYLLLYTARALGGRVGSQAAGVGAPVDGSGGASAIASPSVALPFTSGRNSDLKEVTLHVPARSLLPVHTAFGPTSADQAQLVGVNTGDGADGPTIPLTFAAAYGFRNIQAVVNKMKRNRGKAPPYAYVEIMACPSGCVNGGGLVKADVEAARAEKDADRSGSVSKASTPAVVADGDAASPSASLLLPAKPPNALKEAVLAQKQRVVNVSKLVNDRLHAEPSDTLVRLLQQVPVLAKAYGSTPTPAGSVAPVPLPSASSGPGWKWLLHTRFHAIPKLEATAIKW